MTLRQNLDLALAEQVRADRAVGVLNTAQTDYNDALKKNQEDNAEVTRTTNAETAANTALGQVPGGHQLEFQQATQVLGEATQAKQTAIGAAAASLITLNSHTQPGAAAKEAARKRAEAAKKAAEAAAAALKAALCFIRDTPVTTDQGSIKIQEINVDIHTINGKQILAITKTILDGDILVRVEKDAFSEDCPNHSVVMSGNHKILYNGELHKSKDLALKMTGKLNYVEYMGDTLYNVLMEDHQTMMVNNMVVETLDPENKIALLYRCLLKASNSERIETMKKYAKIVN